MRFQEAKMQMQNRTSAEFLPSSGSMQYSTFYVFSTSKYPFGLYHCTVFVSISQGQISVIRLMTRRLIGSTCHHRWDSSFTYP